MIILQITGTTLNSLVSNPLFDLGVAFVGVMIFLYGEPKGWFDPKPSEKNILQNTPRETNLERVANITNYKTKEVKTLRNALKLKSKPELGLEYYLLVFSDGSDLPATNKQLEWIMNYESLLGYKMDGIYYPEGIITQHKLQVRELEEQSELLANRVSNLESAMKISSLPIEEQSRLQAEKDAAELAAQTPLGQKHKKDEDEGV